MAKLIYDAVATIRYVQGGEEKKRYQKMGVVFEGDKGMNIKIESIPVNWDGWISLYEPKPKEGAAKTAAKKDAGFDDAAGDIPFANPYGCGLWRSV
jgi:hypothetical protein